MAIWFCCVCLQSSVVSDITLRSRIRQPPGGDERSVESEPRNSAEGNESSTPSVTLRPHDRTTDDSGSSVWFPHSPPSRRRLSAETEITEASPSESGSGHEEEGAPSVVSIDTAVPEPESGGEARRASRKRRQLWDHLRRGGENLRKRLCCCFSPSMTDQEEATSEGDGFRIGGGNLQTEGGILRSDVEMDSATSRHVQQVIDQHGGFAILAGDRLADYERRMHEMLETYFDRRSGLEILRLWRLDAARSMPLRVEMLPSSAPGQRILTLGDVRLLSSPRDPMDRRDDSLFRYFMSYEGLSQRMLIPGRA